jgi:hypothetical protein
VSTQSRIDTEMERQQILRESGLLQQLTGWQTLYLLNHTPTDLLLSSARSAVARNQS